MGTLRATLTKIYLYGALSEFMLITALYAVMFSDRGLTTTQISWLFVGWSAASIIAEIPTGALADRYPRKNILFVSQMLDAVGLLIWIIWPSFWGFGLGFVLGGVGAAFSSGTYEALVYDTLKKQKQANRYVKVIGKAETFALIAVVAAAVVASPAVLLGYNFVIAASIAAAVLAGLVALTIPGADPQKPESGYLKSIGEGFKQAFHNRSVRWVIWIAGIGGALYGTVDEYFSLFFSTINVKLEFIPLAIAIVVLAAAIATYVAHRFETLSNRWLMFLLALSGLAIIVVAEVTGIVAIALIGLYGFLSALLEVVFDGKLQHAITGRLRATITSVVGFLAELISIAMFLVFGYISDTYSLFTAFQVFGGLTIASAIIFYVARLIEDRKRTATSS